VQAASTGLKAANFKLSISTPHSFWSSSGINTVAADIGKAIDFMSLISHDLPGTVSRSPGVAMRPVTNIDFRRSSTPTACPG
jgi:hypothetical protein